MCGGLDERRFGAALDVISMLGCELGFVEAGRLRSLMPQLLRGISRAGSCGGGAFML